MLSNVLNVGFYILGSKLVETYCLFLMVIKYPYLTKRNCEE